MAVCRDNASHNAAINRQGGRTVMTDTDVSANREISGIIGIHQHIVPDDFLPRANSGKLSQIILARMLIICDQGARVRHSLI
jgi:hypothetical protein